MCDVIQGRPQKKMQQQFHADDLIFQISALFQIRFKQWNWKQRTENERAKQKTLIATNKCRRFSLSRKHSSISILDTHKEWQSSCVFDNKPFRAGVSNSNLLEGCISRNECSAGLRLRKNVSAGRTVYQNHQKRFLIY